MSANAAPPDPASLMPLARLIATGRLEWQEVFLTYCQVINAAIDDASSAAAAVDRWDVWLGEAVARAEAELIVAGTIRPLVAKQAPPAVVLAAAEAVNRHAGSKLPQNALRGVITDVARQVRRQRTAIAA